MIVAGREPTGYPPRVPLCGTNLGVVPQIRLTVPNLRHSMGLQRITQPCSPGRPTDLRGAAPATPQLERALRPVTLSARILLTCRPGGSRQSERRTERQGLTPVSELSNMPRQGSG